MRHAHRCAIHHHGVNVAGVRHSLHDPILGPRTSPAIETVVNRSRWALLIWQITPRDSGPQDVEYAIEHAPIIHVLDASTVVGEHRLDERPLQIAQV